MRSRLKKYELLRLIASGGMAELHLARTVGPHGIQKLLVIKRLLPELAANRQFARMFIDEARLAVALDHPNIVQVYDVDEVDGIAFYAMEVLYGRDLRRIARRARTAGVGIPLESAVAIAIAMCQALHYAHEKLGARGEPLGIVHRDVSPHNVLVRYDGVVKVIDFGIAKAANRFDRTSTGVLKGKFGYMSPEQCLGQPLDPRSDVFCIAIVLWELTTGRRLFQGESEYRILKQVVETEAPAPGAVVPGYPPELERIVQRGLVRDRAGRYASARAMQLELEAFARERALDVSSAALGRYMEQLFPEEVTAWREGRLEPPPPDAALDEGDDEHPTEQLPIARPDDTKSASVTETQAQPVRAGWPVRAAVLVSVPIAIVGLALLVRAQRAAPAAGADDAAAATTPASVTDEPRPLESPSPPSEARQAETASVAPTPLPSATTAAPRAPSSGRAPTRRPRPTPPPRPSVRPDPDAPLPF